MKYENNLVVIGAGSAGLIAALIAATVKARVSLVESGAMGGDCLNTGCVPSKTLIASAKAAHVLSHGERYGLKNVVGEVDFAKVMARVRDAIATIAPKDSMERYESLGVRCLAGHAKVVDGHTVEVGDRRLTTRRIVVAAGAEPFVPPIPGIGDVDILTSDNVWDLNELPGRLAVLGGGPIGCELAQAFARLGSQVALIDMEDRLLPREDPDAAAVVETVLAEEGVEVLTGHRATRIDPDAITLDTADRSGKRVPFDRILVAVGRRARSTGFGLEDLGVQTNRDGTLVVNGALRTTSPTIYACGDVIGPYQTGAVSAGSIHGQDDPISLDGNDKDPCGDIGSDGLRDGCRAAIAICGEGNVKSMSVTTDKDGTGSVSVTVGKKGGEVTGGGGSQTTTDIVCRGTESNDSGSNDSGSSDSGS
ncbi:MAG: FAD-dependent oxidoreductase [Gammaproteobacteria bacterium]|nr:FAD-dependent oxidoreductase [Gammaproteobacteria bacterium]